ncbi:MAG: hypothetical protein OEZ43_05640 [Gammaproteobacteria bacterium]|nr:hypothetical protein [Gammaproteobacteria bacterium]
MKERIRQLTLLPLLLWLFSTQQAAALTFDIRGEYENWHSGLGGTSTAFLGGISASHGFTPEFSLAGSVVAGNYETNSTASSDVSRFDVDITTSYRIYPLTSVFIGYQLIQLDVNIKDNISRSFDDTMHALGAGITNYIIMNRDWVLYGGFSLSGVFATSTLGNGTKDNGLGFSTGVNGGVLYLVSKELTLAGGIKTRLNSVDYRGDSGTWSHNMQRLTLSLSRAW